MKRLILLAALALPAQTALDLTASWTTDADLDRVAAMRGLERLRLAQTRVTDAGMERLRGLENLRELDLYFAEFFTDDGIAALRDCRKLERLNLRGTRVTSRVLESIAKLESLRELDLSYTQIDDANFDLLADLPRLERLAAGGTRIGPLAITSLKLVPSLRHLDLSGMQRVDSGHWGITLNAAVLEEIGALENLISLNLSGAVLNDIGADKPGLKAEERQSLEGLDRLARLRNLEQLDLSRTPVNAAGLRELGALPRLRELRLTRARQITDDAVPLLAAWKSLQIVRLDGTGISPDGMARLRSLRPDLRVPGGS